MKFITLIMLLLNSVFAYSQNTSSLNIAEFYNEYLDQTGINNKPNRIVLIKSGDVWDLKHDDFYSEILDKLFVDIKNGYLFISFHFGDGIEITEAALFTTPSKRYIGIYKSGALYSHKLLFYEYEDNKLVQVSNSIIDLYDFKQCFDNQFYNQNKDKFELLNNRRNAMQSDIFEPNFTIPRFGTTITQKFELSYKAKKFIKDGNSNLSQSDIKLINFINDNIKYRFEYKWDEINGRFIPKKI